MTDELITVHSFALRYRVDASIIRAWIKRGAIPYELVGPRKMRLKVGDMLHPIQPTAVIGNFADYPLGIEYMRRANGEGSTDREAGMGEGSNEEGAERGPSAATGGDVEHSRRFAPLPQIKGRGRRTA